jgi:hypothetical protein
MPSNVRYLFRPRNQYAATAAKIMRITDIFFIFFLQIDTLFMTNAGYLLPTAMEKLPVMKECSFAFSVGDEMDSLQKK